MVHFSIILVFDVFHLHMFWKKWITSKSMVPKQQDPSIFCLMAPKCETTSPQITFSTRAWLSTGKSYYFLSAKDKRLFGLVLTSVYISPLVSFMFSKHHAKHTCSPLLCATVFKPFQIVCEPLLCYVFFFLKNVSKIVYPQWLISSLQRDPLLLFSLFPLLKLIH